MSRAVVLKFGSSVLRTDADVRRAVHAIYGEVRRGRRVVAVTSAVGDATDRLLARAHHVAEQPAEPALAVLLATGERASAALLALALDQAGIPAVVRDPPFVVEGSWLDADPVSLGAAFPRAPVVVVPGFFGVREDGSVALLGRGGSDLTAVFLAHQLKASCRLMKDVAGVCDRDPADGPARRYASLTFGDAAASGGRVIQSKAMAWAAAHGVRFRVHGERGAGSGTLVGSSQSRLAPRSNGSPLPPPLRVALLGLGTVGLGVYRHLIAHPDRFVVTGIAVRDLARHAPDAPRALLSTDAMRVATGCAEVVVEAIGGLEPAASLIRAALTAGKRVVTANKAVVAVHGASLGTRCVYSAAVGGAVPVLETVRRLAVLGDITRIDAVLNGTTNFVLDRLAEGVVFDEAVREAQRRGFAEADPTLDLDGTDAAHKLRIIAREAFGEDIDVERTGIEGVTSGRLVASVWRSSAGLRAVVKPRTLPGWHPLARVRNEENAAVIRRASGRPVVVRGRGAGRWPTAEAVFADLLDVAAAC